MATTTVVPTEKPPDLPDFKPSSLTFPDKKKWEPKNVDWSEEELRAIERWLYEQIRVRKQQYEVLHKTLVPKWRRLYKGQPRDKKKSFPWENASNLVIQIIGQEIDDLSARVIGLSYATSPLAIFRYLAKQEDPQMAGKKQQALEQFFDLAGYEPTELNLYPKESFWFADAARLGTSWVKAMPVERSEVVVGYSEQDSKVLYRGPMVANIRFEDMLNDPYSDTPEDSPVNIHIRPLNRKDLEERIASKFYDPEVVKQILGSPDRHGVSEEKKKEQRGKGISGSDENVLAEWDIYECWFKWLLNGKKYSLTWSFHYSTKKTLRKVFNIFPENQLPFVRTKVNYAEHGMNGYGYAEMLEHSQEEASTIHNQGIDATTMGITGIIRASTRGAKNLDKNIQVYPFAIVPGEKDDIEAIQLGNAQMVALSQSNAERTFALAHERSGVGPAVAGMGSGQVRKKGQYGSLGTLAVMQDGNSRVNHRISDYRNARVKLYTLLTTIYAMYGVGDKAELFGIDQNILNQALDEFLSHRVRIPIRAATANANEEVRKQNEILLYQVLKQHQQAIIQMLQAVENPGITDPSVKKYFFKAIGGLDALMTRMMRSFGFDLPSEFVPDTSEIMKEGQQNAQEAPGANVNPMAALIARARASQGAGAQPGVGAARPGADGNAPGVSGANGQPPNV